MSAEARRVVGTPVARVRVERAQTSSKIGPRHLERLAMVYVRQSTAQQLVKHQESTRLQYGLVERALDLGWAKERVLVIDDDMGRSGTSAEGRPGFQKLVAEVGLDHVGVILGVEMSRLARSCRDWHQLLEVCALFGTLIADLDGIYDPANYNDRLLLGLKGTMSEAELHILKQRMLQGKLQKAKRGELGVLLPIGYIRRPSGEVVKEPDEQAQSVVGLVFSQFEAFGTLNGVLRYLVENGIKLPVRIVSGLHKGDLEWRRPNRETLQNMLHNPVYAGAYAYGRRRVDGRHKKPGRPGTGRIVVPKGEWQVVLKGHRPAYISWEDYERNLSQLEQNRARALGAPRHGPSLLSGLLRCGRCSHRMAVSYSNGCQRYSCSRDAVDYGAPFCQSLAGKALDAKISELVLQALQPSALEVSMRVAEDLEVEHRRLEQNWKQRTERAQYEVDRAARQYNEVEPENRLVARTLESQLEEKLVAQRTVEEEHHRWLARQPSPLSAEERKAIKALASDIPALWNASTTTSLEKQTIIRQLIEDIVVTVERNTERVKVVVHWVGGHKTETEVTRPVARLDQLSYWPKLIARILELRGKGLTSKGVAHQLNVEGWRPAKRRLTFNGEMVRTILSRQGLTRWNGRKALPARPKLKPGEWYLADLAAKLSMPVITLHSWIRRSWVKAHQLDIIRRPWVIRADAQELARLMALRAAPKLGWRAKVGVPVGRA